MFAVKGAWASEELIFTEAQISALGIEVVNPAIADVAPGPSYPARVELPPGQEHVVTAGEGGVVEAVLASEGQTVAAGEPLLRLRSAGIAALEREYLQAREQAALARQQTERDEALYREGIIPERRVQESRSALAQAHTLSQGARQALEAAGLDAKDLHTLEQTGRVSSTQILRAPFTATVLEVMVRNGEQADPSTPLLRLGQTSTLWLEIRVPVEDLAGLSVGAGVQVLHATVLGRVILIGQQVEPADQSVAVRAEIHTGAESLRPGQLLQVSLLEPSGAHAFRLPASAVVHRGEGQYVFVQSPQGFRVEPVRVLSTSTGDVVVNGTLSTDDRVAVKGIAALKGAWLGIGGE
ncbi:efflux RND transporter periplasmic adaptor subunit [Thioalkalivibrio sulfidiphilus]|uniref:efflux RND transporter periplasmic adaptor subunit n=1 Tax=Thioalkalivibrio sulfidiphilus TaxID=1033854 RepID=UPI00164F79DC|nr:efflux RND transporter periplasmic adaptor subunit [Thioalkalivibrio sulfidiphilus]